MIQEARTLNQSKAEQFSEQMLDTINKAALALMTSIGHQTGLFDTMASLPPATSERIANAAGLNERYVREWLGAMTAGQFVEYDPQTKTYALPVEHAVFLTRAASPNNLAVPTQFLPMLGAVEDKIIHSFINGGGVPYSEYPSFHRIMEEESNQTVVAGLIDNILPIVPGITQALRDGIEVLDVGCGSGRALNRLAKEFPQSNFTGYDFSEAAIGKARKEAERMGLHNVHFEVQNLSEWYEPGRYQLITAFDVIHDQAHPRRVLKAIHVGLRPEGIFLMQDIRASSDVHQNVGHPLGPFTYTISCLHCMTVSLALDGALIIVSATAPDQAAFCRVLDRLAAGRAGTSRRSNNQENKSAGLAPKNRSAAVVPSDRVTK